MSKDGYDRVWWVDTLRKDPNEDGYLKNFKTSNVFNTSQFLEIFFFISWQRYFFVIENTVDFILGFYVGLYSHTLHRSPISSCKGDYNIKEGDYRQPTWNPTPVVHILNKIKIMMRNKTFSKFIQMFLRLLYRTMLLTCCLFCILLSSFSYHLILLLFVS